MKCKNLISTVIGFSLIFFSCGQESQKSFQIKDIIPVVNVIAGTEKTVLLSDLFYSNSYDVEFIPNNHFEINYNKATRLLKLSAKYNFKGLSEVSFKFNDEILSFMVRVKKLPELSFSFEPGKDYKTLTVFGEFNSWNREQYYFKDDDGDGTFNVTFPAEPGKYQYKFYGDGEEILDPSNSWQVPNGIGGINNVVAVNDPDSVRSFLHLISFNNKFEFIYENNSNKKITVENVIGLRNNTLIDKELISVDGNKIIISPCELAFKGKQNFRIAITEEGKTTNIQNIILFNGIPAGKYETPFTWQDGIIYSLLIDRFNDGDPSLNRPIVHDSLFDKANYNGGDLQGIIDKLNEGYFDNLGITILWISPVMDNPNEAFREYPAPHRWFTGYHGYWPISAYRVEEHFGTFDKVKELVDIAHEHNIKVLLDFVSNHVHEQHPYYQEHPDWFGKLELPDGTRNLRLWDEQRLTTWFEPYMPSFDYSASQEAIDTMTSNAVWWLKATGADGYRHDAVKHVPNEFWRELTRKMKAEVEAETGNHVYQIGETFGGYDLVSSYVNNGQLDAQFAFNLYNVAQTVFIDPKASFAALDQELIKNFHVYGYNHIMGNIMDSHDKNRFMAYTDGDLELSQWSAIEEGWNNPPKVDDPKSYDKAILYLAYMNAIPGLPVIYYGSEFGMTGASDPDNRRMMRFNDQLDQYEKRMLENVQKIINIRKNHSALRYGDYYKLTADENIFAFIRSDLNERILLVLNKSEKEITVQLELPVVYRAEKILDLIDGSELVVTNNAVKITLPPISYSFWELR